MYFLNNVYLEIVLVFAIIGTLVYWGSIIGMARTMKNNEKKMQEMNVLVSGSLVSHGMVRNRNKGIGVVRDSQPSDNWFRKLIH